MFYLKQHKFLFSFLLIFVFSTSISFAQKRKRKKSNSNESAIPAATDAIKRLDDFKKKQELKKNSLVSNIPFTNVGPTVMSGRVADLDVSPDDPSVFYVAYASGGLWKTESNGTDFTPLFDNEASMTIGDIAVDWKNNETIWVGTGENNSSRSSYAGTGIYKSNDGGKSWQNMGLIDAHHVGRIILHPSDPNTLWVGVIGHLYSDNAERGVYKTTDGGKTWEKVLYIDNKTGIIDLVIDPSNANTLYAAAWQRDRKSWHFEGSGEGSGIYKTTDGGKNWNKITDGSNGFPTTKGVGRIGLAVAPSQPQTIYAVLDNQDRREKEKEEKEYKVTKDILKSITKDAFLALTDDDINEYLDQNRFPQEYNAVDIKKDIKSDDLKPLDLVSYLEDANSLLFDTPVKGAEVYRSDDGGKTWKKTHEKYIDDLVYSYGYYFGQIRVNPVNADHIYTFGVPVIKSKDGGKTWESINGRNVHADHHALWVNPKREGHLVLGNDGGINISYDDGKTWIKSNSLPVGQFYAINVDMEKPYNIYGGLQDNGVWYGKNTYKRNDSWHGSGEYPYKRIMGGDGMQVAIDTRDNNTVYTGFQFGYYYRVDKTTKKSTMIKPVHKLGESPLRFNWQSPIHLSRHNQDVLYFGSNKFHRSLNKGDNMETLSGDLTQGGKKGNVPYGTLATIDESPLKFGLLYVGSDDGLIHVSKDGGYNWENISAGLPKDYWVSRVTASKFKESRVYASLNGYRWDDFTALIYVSEDYGKTWTQIGKDLPAEPVNVIKEDPENENLLYIGTDHSLYITLDRGKSFMLMDKNLPAVAIHDLVIHPRDKDLVVGTHGRSIFKADVKYLQQLSSEIIAKDLHVFSMGNKKYSSRWGNKGWSRWYKQDGPNTTFTVYLKAGGEVTAKVKTPDGIVLKEFSQNITKGVNYLEYDLTIDEKSVDAYKKEWSKEKKDFEIKKPDNEKYYIQAGKYKVELKIGSTSIVKDLEIKAPRARPKRKPMKKTP